MFPKNISSPAKGRQVSVDIGLNKYILRSIKEVERDEEGSKINGHIFCLSGRRLLDQLNGVFPDSKEDYISFLPLKEAEIDEGNCNFVCLNKRNIVFVSELVENETKELGLKNGNTGYPFVAKSAIRVKIKAPFYKITGNLHLAGSERASDVFNLGNRFLPLTDVDILNIFSGVRQQNICFLALNKEQVVFVEEV